MDEKETQNVACKPAKTQTGAKISLVADVMCFLGSICSAIIGIVLMAAAAEAESGTAWIGFVVLVAGVTVSWACSVILQGFGELVMDTQETAFNTRALLEKTKED